jgi:hypothetical protein
VDIDTKRDTDAVTSNTRNKPKPNNRVARYGALRSITKGNLFMVDTAVGESTHTNNDDQIMMIRRFDEYAPHPRSGRRGGIPAEFRPLKELEEAGRSQTTKSNQQEEKILPASQIT